MCAPGNKSILFHRSADLERWIRSILIPHFQYDMIRHKFQRHLLRPSVIRALPWNSATEARETWGKAPTTPHNRNAQEATSKPATCIFYAWTLLRSALTLFLSSSPSTLRKCTSIYTRSPAAYRTVHGLEVGNQTSHFFLLRKRRRYRCLDKISWGVIQIPYQEYGEVVGVVFRFAMSPFPSIFDAHFPSSHTLPFVTCTVLPESLLLALMTSIVYRVGFVILDTHRISVPPLIYSSILWVPQWAV